MALIKFGGPVIEARGSVAGTTFSRNRSGAYIRARVKPVNPNSPRQASIRAIQSSMGERWLDSASAAQRVQWGVFADNVPAKNLLGEVISLSGWNQFVKSNVTAKNAGLPQILDGPAIFTLPAQDSDVEIAVSEASQEISVTFNESRDWVDESNSGMIVEMGIPQNPTINFFVSPYRHAGLIRGDDSTAPTSPATVAVPFPVVEGQKIFAQTKIIRDDGRVSDWFQVNVLCGS